MVRTNFTINVPQGTREGALKAVQAATVVPENGDKAQLEAAKLLIAAEIKALDPKFNGVRITATGDAHDGGRTMQITVVPLQVHL